MEIAKVARQCQVPGFIALPSCFLWDDMFDVEFKHGDKELRQSRNTRSNCARPVANEILRRDGFKRRFVHGHERPGFNLQKGKEFQGQHGGLIFGALFSRKFAFGAFVRKDIEPRLCLLVELKLEQFPRYLPSEVRQPPIWFKSTMEYGCYVCVAHEQILLPIFGQVNLPSRTPPLWRSVMPNPVLNWVKKLLASG